MEPTESVSRWATYQPGERGHGAPVGLEIRPADRAECDAIAAIAAARDGVDPHRAAAACVSQVADRDMLLLVALMANRVVAFARAGRLRQPDSALPDGWYLLGVVVVDRWRRHGIGRALTERRVAWLSQRTDSVHYIANSRNQASLDLHAGLGFVEVARGFTVSGMTFEGGEGVLCRLALLRDRLTGAPEQA
jgi:GNAT superfamily N-acetyltransferase